jgi:hypothetical protein
MQAAQKDLRSKAREVDELRRTLQYVEANRASATKLMRPFQQALYLELSRHIRRKDLIDRELSRE